MNHESILLILRSVLIVSLSLSIVYTSGIVWRVEQRLDASYKLFLVAIIFLFGAEVIDLYAVSGDRFPFDIAAVGFRAIFGLLFLMGMLLMRGIVRNLDGERKRRR